MLIKQFTVQQHPKHERLTKDDENTDFEPQSNILEDKELFEVVHVAKSKEERKPVTKSGIIEQVIQLKISPRMPLKQKCVVENKTVNAPAAPPAAAHSHPAKSTQEPSVYKFTEIYDAKKKARLETIREQEKHQRQFHSQPAPNFSAIHDAAGKRKKQMQQQFTCPMTPAVLRRHKESQEKLKKLVSDAEMYKLFLGLDNPS